MDRASDLLQTYSLRVGDVTIKPLIDPRPLDER